MSMRSSGEAGRTPPVDDETYDVIQTLTSKLEAIEVYEQYVSDGGQQAQLFRQLAEQDRQTVGQLLDVLTEQLSRRRADGHGPEPASSAF